MLHVLLLELCQSLQGTKVSEVLPTGLTDSRVSLRRSGLLPLLIGQHFSNCLKQSSMQWTHTTPPISHLKSWYWSFMTLWVQVETDTSLQLTAGHPSAISCTFSFLVFSSTAE